MVLRVQQFQWGDNFEEKKFLIAENLGKGKRDRVSTDTTAINLGQQQKGAKDYMFRDTG